MDRSEDFSDSTRNLTLYLLSQKLWGDAVRLYQQDCGVTATEAEVAVEQLAERYGFASQTDSVWYRILLGVVLLTCGLLTLAWMNFALSS